MRFFISLFYLMVGYSSFAQCNTHILVDNSFTMCKGNSIQINTNTQLKQYHWWPAKGMNDNTAISPIVSPDSTITYFVQAVDANGCTSKDSITVYVIDCSLPGQFITIDNNDFGSGKINPAIKSYDSIIPVTFIPLSGNPPSAFTKDGYTVVNKIPQSLNNDWHTGALDHTANDGDSGYMAVFHNAPADGILFDNVYKDVNPYLIISNTTAQFSFSYAYPFNKPLNSYCSGNNYPAAPNLKVKIIVGNMLLSGKFQRMKATPCGNPGYPTGCIDSDSLFLYPDAIASNPDGSMLWNTFTSPYILPFDIAGYINLCFRIQIINDTPPSPCGNDIALDDIQFNHYVNFNNFSFRLPYDTIQTCIKGSNTFTSTDFVNTSSRTQYNWYKSLDKGKTWQLIPNNNINQKQIIYAAQQKEEWIRLEGLDFSVAPVQRFQSNYFVILSDTLPIANAGADTMGVCKGSSLQLHASGGNYNVWTPSLYLSDTSILNPIVTPLTNMQYVLKTSNKKSFSADCTTYDTIKIKIDDKPIVVAGQNQTINFGNAATMNPTITGNDFTIDWEPKQYFIDNTQENAICKTDSTRTFYLYANSNYGCGNGLDSMKIIIVSGIKIPNVFSPNGDGINDTWDLSFLKNYPYCSVDIFNRYGQLLFHSIGYTKNWDGNYNNQALPIGTYYYIIKTSSAASPIAGSVTIVR